MRELMIAMRDACFSIAHNYRDGSNKRAVEIAAGIERMIRELEPEDVIDPK